MAYGVRTCLLLADFRIFSCGNRGILLHDVVDSRPCYWVVEPVQENVLMVSLPLMSLLRASTVLSHKGQFLFFPPFPQTITCGM